LFRHLKKASFKTTVTQALTTITLLPPLQLGISHRLPLHNSGALPSVHERFKLPSYISINSRDITISIVTMLRAGRPGFNSLQRQW